MGFIVICILSSITIVSLLFYAFFSEKPKRKLVFGNDTHYLAAKLEREDAPIDYWIKNPPALGSWKS